MARPEAATTIEYVESTEQGQEVITHSRDEGIESAEYAIAGAVRTGTWEPLPARSLRPLYVLAPQDIVIVDT